MDSVNTRFDTYLGTKLGPLVAYSKINYITSINKLYEYINIIVGKNISNIDNMEIMSKIIDSNIDQIRNFTQFRNKITNGNAIEIIDFFYNKINSIYTSYNYFKKNSMNNLLIIYVSLIFSAIGSLLI